MDGTRVYYAKQNKSVREKQISNDFTHLWNLRNKINKQREKVRERQSKKQILNYRGQTDGYQRGDGWRVG